MLTTLTKLFAPIMPFLSEAMYQNLAASGWRKLPDDASNQGAYALRSPNSSSSLDSVHLCDFPVVDKRLVDEQLSADMDALLRLVSLGSAARNSVKIKVRQPLAEIKVQPSNEAERRSIERFGDQVAEELNIKKVSIHANGQPLLRTEVKPNLKTLGPKFGNQLQEVKKAIESQSDAIAASL